MSKAKENCCGTDQAYGSSDVDELYCFLHMGMTGRISTQSYIPKLESLRGDDKYPPPHTHLILRCDGYEVAFSDPRRFGAVTLSESLSDFHELATDGLNEVDPNQLIGKKRRIKAILLDQKAAVSGIGNWVADEVLYQSGIHPEQSYLTRNEVEGLLYCLHQILETAVKCLKEDKKFPDGWIFHLRWRKGEMKHTDLKDCKGRNISFISVGGRSSAIVKGVQKLCKRSQTYEVNNDEESNNISDKRQSVNDESKMKRKRSREACGPNP